MYFLSFFSLFLCAIPMPRKSSKALPPSSQNNSRSIFGVAGVPNPSLSRAARTGEATEDELLLERPKLPHPVPRMPAHAEFTRGDPWRVLRIMGEYVHGFDALA